MLQEYETNTEIVSEKTKEISKTLRNLTSGEKTEFPLIQYDSINTGIQRLQKKYKANGWRWKTKTNETHIEVTRVA